MTAPLVSPVKAQGVKMAQVDMQTGRHYEDRDDHDYRDRRRYDSNVTVGVGPGGIKTIGPRQPCRMETTTIERDGGRRITRRERVCGKTARQRKARQPAGRSQYPLSDKRIQ